MLERRLQREHVLSGPGPDVTVDESEDVGPGRNGKLGSPEPFGKLCVGHGPVERLQAVDVVLAPVRAAAKAVLR